MILLSDLICHDRASPFAPVRHAADRLRKPAQNHAPGDIATPALERFVFGREESDSLLGLVISMDNRRARSPLILPFSEFWMELDVAMWRCGFLVEGCFEDGGSEVSVFLNLKDKKSPHPFVRFFVDGSGGIDPLELLPLIPEVNDGVGPYYLARMAQAFFEAAITALTRTRMASTRRTHRYEGFPNIGVATRRAAQRGAPVYSFNIVKFAFPQVSIQRGETVQSVGDGVRGHWVIGHWRYVDKNTVEPHFTWVPAHKRGNEALGFITKQRNFNTTKHAARGLPPRVKGAFGPAV